MRVLIHPLQRLWDGHRVEKLHGDAPPPRLVDDDPGIGIQGRVVRRADEERLVDGVPALDVGDPTLVVYNLSFDETDETRGVTYYVRLRGENPGSTCRSFMRKFL